MIARLIAVYGLMRLFAILLTSVVAAIALATPGGYGLKVTTLILWLVVLAESASFAIFRREA